jgi:hypothetical protein
MIRRFFEQVQGRFGGTPALTNENVGDWFEYVWSMTRAIRKDVTQQVKCRTFYDVALDVALFMTSHFLWRRTFL